MYKRQGIESHEPLHNLSKYESNEYTPNSMNNMNIQLQTNKSGIKTKKIIRTKKRFSAKKSSSKKKSSKNDNPEVI